MSKRLSGLIAGILFVLVMLAFSFSALAIDFDAETSYSSIFVVTSGGSLGSGFSVGANCIITNAHVISNKQRVSITTYDGDSYDAFVAEISEELDIAVLGVESASFTPLPIGNIDNMSVGDDVYAIGAPNSLAYTLTKGCLSAKSRKAGTQHFIQTDAAINTGNSGGPLLNSAGEVIGVNSYKMSDAEGIGLAIPMPTVIVFLNDCGIDTDEAGNVINPIHMASTESPTKSDETERSTSTRTKNATNPLTIILMICLGCSAALNIVLIILLAYQKRKNIDLAYNPKERTDFEIDILE